MNRREKVLHFVAWWAGLTFVVGTAAALGDWNTHEYTRLQHYGYAALTILALQSFTITVVALLHEEGE